MDSVTLACEQAIFTSIRGRMGEGYRLVAASRGLTPADKQAITRLSPSHESMCTDPSGPHDAATAVSFYALPSGRLCVAYSCLAGAEHTGRGGSRVYTRCLVFAADGFANAGFSPFAVVRAMQDAGLTNPELKPTEVLSPIDLQVSRIRPSLSTASTSGLSPQARASALVALLDGRRVILDLSKQWVPCAEALLISLPGPLRTQVPMSAGLRYATGRRHQLQLLHDEKRVLRHRLAAEPIEYIDSPEAAPKAHGADGDARPSPSGGTGASSWLDFVERMWKRGDFSELARRTSRPFADSSAPALERVGSLYNTIDTLAELPPERVLVAAEGSLHANATGAEAEVHGELVQAGQSELGQRLSRMPWPQASELWATILELWRRSSASAAFAEPLIERMLRMAAAVSPLVAAEAALHLELKPPGQDYTERLRPAVDNALRRFAAWLPQAPAAEREQAESVATRWQRVRPSCSIVRSLAGTAAAS